MSDETKEIKMTKRNAIKMRSLLKKTSDYNTKYYEAQSALNELTVDIFGHCASDIDSDYIIDSIFGGSGASSSMDLEEYVEHMNIDGNTKVVLPT